MARAGTVDPGFVAGTGLTLSAGTLTNDLLTGKAGGQTVIGGTAASENLDLRSTANATRGKIRIGRSGANTGLTVDEANSRVGVNVDGVTNFFEVWTSGGSRIAMMGDAGMGNVRLAKASVGSPDVAAVGQFEVMSTGAARILHVQNDGGVGFRNSDAAAGEASSSMLRYRTTGAVNRLQCSNNNGTWANLTLDAGTVALGGGAAPTLGTIGGTGPAAAAQNAWLQLLIGTTTYFVPIWQ